MNTTTFDIQLVSETNSGAALSRRVQSIVAVALKRVIDVVGASLGLLLLSPVLLLAALAIVIENPGSPLFQQKRGGYRGAAFVIFKFRSMRVSENGADVVQAQQGDHRVTRVGAFLRRTSIDELPQLLNVLRGEMSLVGPRPHALLHDEYYGQRISGYNGRFRAKPGLTGLAQTSGLRGATPDVASMAARVNKDLEYIRNWSLMLDVVILLRTLRIVTIQPDGY